MSDIRKIDKEDCVSLTDLARYANSIKPKVPVATWRRNKDVISYLELILSCGRRYITQISKGTIFFVPVQLAALRSGRSAYATKSRQEWIDIRDYRMIQGSYTPDGHKKGPK